ncbi:MAG: DsbA family protein [Sandaracinaceae bacterium]
MCARTTLLFLALALAACGGGIRTIPDGPGPWGERQDLARMQVPLEGAPSRGADHPLVELVVFNDLECEHCRGNAAVLARALDAHPDSLRIHFRHLPLPFHAHAEMAAQALEEARAQRGDGAFWAMHDRVFAASAPPSEESITEIARAIGLDMARFRAALERQVHVPRIEADIELADRVGADGTPTMFLNGRPIYGALPYRQLEEILDEEIALARAALAHGVPRDGLYTVAMRSARENADPPPPPPAEPGEGMRLDRSVTYSVPVAGAPSLGPADALVTMVMFSDFQCPFCARVMPTLRALLDRYPEDLRIVFRHNPLPSHPDAYFASMAAAEAQEQGGDAAFWRMHDVLLANPMSLDRDSVGRYAREVGLDQARLLRAVDEEAHADRIERDRQAAMQLGARMTPSFYVNGRLVSGAQPLGVFVDQIEDALAAARERVAHGTPRAEVYAAIVREGTPQAVWTAETPDHFEIPVPAEAPRRGASEPEVVVQMFSDFECPYCRMAQPTLMRLIEEHPEVQLAYRHYPLPFHERARPAAYAAIEMQRQRGDEGFWAFHDALLERRGLDPEELVALAAELGADPAEVRRAIEEERGADRVDADLAAVANAGLRIGTPSFLVGTVLIVGARPYEELERALSAQRVPDVR